MTDVLDPDLEPRTSEVEVDVDVEVRTASDAPVRWWLASLMIGAGAIHLVMAPSHLGETAVEGAGFVAAGWVQIGLGIALVLRPSRRTLGSVVVANLALIAAWAVSRTAGLPFGEHRGHPETVSVVDGATVALEAMAVIVAGFVLAVPFARVVRSARVAVAGATVALVATTAAIASPSARDHAAGSHGDHGSSTSATAGGGHHTTDADDRGFAALSNGHQHERGTQPLTPDETVTLAGQLATTTELVARYPTLADAEAAGWTRAGPFSPGLGTHYQGPQLQLNPDGRMDREDLLAPMLIFDGLTPDAKLAGFMYLAYGVNGEPEGFAGPNDHWHYHENVCIVMQPDGTIDTPFGADLDGVTQQMCTDAGGAWIAATGYMVHVWNVPGYESPDGMFAELNPAITCPDGTYHRIPIAQLRDGDTMCRTRRPS